MTKNRKTPIEKTKAGFVLLLISLSSLSLNAGSAMTGKADRVFRYGTGARDIAMGQAMVVSASGPSSLYWNPALLARVPSKEVQMFHSSLFEGFSYSYLGYAHPFKGASGMALQVLRYGVSGAERKDEFNNKVGGFSESQTAVGLGAGMKGLFTPGLSLGTSFNALRREMAGRSSTLYGMDVAAGYSFLNERLVTGAALKNPLSFAAGDTRDELPSHVHVGAGYQVIPGFWMALSIEDFSQFSVGAEYSLGRFLTLNAGKAGDGSFSMGTGLIYKKARLDVAFNQNAVGLGSSVSSSIGLRFGADRTQLRNRTSRVSLAKSDELIKRGDWLLAQRQLRRAISLDPTQLAAQDSLDRLNAVLRVLKVKRISDEQRLKEKAVWPLLRNGVAAFLERSHRDAQVYIAYAAMKDSQEGRFKELFDHMVQASGSSLLAPEERDLTPEAFISEKRNRVHIRFLKKEFGFALRECQEIVNLEPAGVKDWERLGSLYFALKMRPKALEAYQKALELDPQNDALKKFIDDIRRMP